jgi:hypothetical protein
VTNDAAVLARKPLSNRDRVIGAAVVYTHELEEISCAQRFGDSRKTSKQFRERLGLVEYRQHDRDQKTLVIGHTAVGGSKRIAENWHSEF